MPLNHSGCQIQELGTGKPEVIPRQNSLLVSTELLRAVGRLLWKDAMKLHRSRPHLVSALAQQKSCNAAAPKAAEAEMPPLRTRTASDLGGTEMRPGRAPNLGHAGAQVSNAGRHYVGSTSTPKQLRFLQPRKHDQASKNPSHSADDSAEIMLLQMQTDV